MPDITPDTQTAAAEWSATAFLGEVERTGARLAVSGDGLTYKKGGDVRVPRWIEAELLAEPGRIEALHGIVAERERQEAETERQDRINATLNDAMAHHQYGSPGHFGGPALPFDLVKVEREVARRTTAIAAELKRRKRAAK